jgi:uncharacterized protein (TIGR02266 family)
VGDDDKRRSDREAVTLVVEYEDAEDMIGDYTENLSTGGTFVSTSRELPIGTRVQLSLGFPGLLEPIGIEGTVRWTRGAHDARGAGIEFEPGPGKDALAAVVERIRARDPRTVSKLVRVLVVEDNVHVCKLIEDGLRGSGRRGLGSVSFVVRSVQDGRQAIEILRREPFDALIIDVYLPILDGPKVIHQARHELGLGDLPIIAVSAGGDSARRSALDAGANIFLDKPMRLRHVLDTIQRLVS